MNNVMTVTSEKIIKHLIKKGIKISEKDKTFIRKKVYKAIVDASQETNNCNCGQLSCGICN